LKRLVAVFKDIGGKSDPANLQSFAAITINPVANRPRVDACGFGDGLRRLPARDLPYNPLSIERREPGIHVYPTPFDAQVGASR
jgi:hypothetical protein